MAVIYLKHPEHGTKVAISDLEAIADMRNGWKIFDPDESPHTEEPGKQAEEGNALVRRGRKPKE